MVAHVPRAKCAKHGVLFILLPWADAGSRFTALFEADAIELLGECSVSAAAKRLGVSWDQAAGIQECAVRRGMERRDAAFPTRIGVDETSFRKRHRYVTVVNDLDSGAVLHVAQDRTKAAPAYDRFHVAQRLSKAVDQVRRGEHRKLKEDAADLKRTRFLWLRSGDSLDEERRGALRMLRRRFTHLGRAWSLKEYAPAPAPKNIVERKWRNWLSWAQHCRLKPMVRAGGMVRRHLDGVVTAVCEGVTNARIQWIKRLANGYRSVERFIMAIMFHLGKLDMRPHAHVIHTNA